MAKTRTSFFCQNCGYESAKWIGKCPSCQEWNSFVEEVKVKDSSPKRIWQTDDRKAIPVLLDKIDGTNIQRISSHDLELDRVLGGGIVPGSIVLVGGEPGIGKSTLMLQLSLNTNLKTLYISGEESEHQIKLRADRISSTSNRDSWILSETDLEQIFSHVRASQPELIIVDSIQTLTSNSLESVAGSVGQVRHCAGELLKYAKSTNTPVFLVGHITKDGSLAGPKVLEHMVDTVLQFEGDSRMLYRLLRTTKNRFGSTSELGIYEMTGHGLRQVENPSEILISQRDTPVSGVSIGATIEGNRVLMIEIQALVTTAAYGTPQRTTTGFEGKRLNMLLAVLEKRTGLKLGTQDVFVNMAGGIKVEDPAIDLAVCIAVLSSLHDISIPEKVCFAAEVGLGGELRAVNRVDNRISEAAKLGFEIIYVSKYNKNLDKAPGSIKVKSFGLLPEIFGDLFG